MRDLFIGQLLQDRGFAGVVEAQHEDARLLLAVRGLSDGSGLGGGDERAGQRASGLSGGRRAARA